MKIQKAIKRYFKNGYRMAHGQKRKKQMRLGDLTEKIINIVTLGQGKRIAMFVANLFGYKDCGCDKRKDKLNKYKLTKDGIKEL